MNTCTAVLMAGGKSSRMGCEKAFLLLDGKPLWLLQREKLLSIADEVLISAKEGMKEQLKSPIILDRTPGLGPLGGLESALVAARHERLVVLGIDMPFMTAAFLNALLEESTNLCGVVPMLAGYFQGLAAVYPRSLLPLVREVLTGEDHSMQHLNRLAVERGLMNVRMVSEGERPLFQNWNTPEDLVH